MNSFRLFGLKRKLVVFKPIAAFFELHTCAEHSRSSRATEGEKGKKWEQKHNFLAD